MTSATRSSRRCFPASSTAFLAASSQVLVLVPMSSITLYVLSGWTTLWVLCAIAHSGRGTTMRLFDPLKKILVFFLLNAIAFVKADPNPPKLVQDLREQFDNLTVVLDR